MQTELGKILQNELLENLNTRFSLIEDVEHYPCFGFSTLLDLRFKKVAFSNIEFANNAASIMSNELASMINNSSSGNLFIAT